MAVTSNSTSPQSHAEPRSDKDLSSNLTHSDEDSTQELPAKEMISTPTAKNFVEIVEIPASYSLAVPIPMSRSKSLPASVTIPPRKSSLEKLLIAKAAETDSILPDPKPAPPPPQPRIRQRPSKLGPGQTPPRRSTYSVWEDSGDGNIVEELVEVNIPSRSGLTDTLTRSRSGGDGDSVFSPVSFASLGREGVVLGTPIREGHANYLLMYDMLTGIRVSVSRCHAKPGRVLDEADFKAAHKLAFDVTGNELLPKATYDFKFKDYAPWVFRQIREQFQVDASEYLLSLTGKYILSELGSPGKSGSFFYFSQDYRFIIKTISKAEHKFFRKILKGYYEHIKANPETLISRIFGLHRVKLPGGQKIRFVVMGNLFPANKDIHETYDLKGSTVGRRVKPENIKPHSTLKDLNFLESNRHLSIGNPKKDIFLDQLERDVLFLQISNVMDYSLLVGVHNLLIGNRENIRDNNLIAFEPSPETLVRRQPSTSRMNSSSGGRGRSRSTSRHRRAQSDGVGIEPSRAVLPDDMPPEKSNFYFYQEMGGMVSTDESGAEGDEVYYLGIIDIFTEYNMTKKAEHFFKSLMGSARTISAVNSVAYGKRFVSFLERCL
ncbi:Phosphatidylinositol-4-phosphate 5-kinase [Chytriomyces hyalinus]|nr:Phosphatidylinositol-4-phosphate 5-kinase [Chytriomyces hyalinus]